MGHVGQGFADQLRSCVTEHVAQLLVRENDRGPFTSQRATPAVACSTVARMRASDSRSASSSCLC